MEIEELTSDVNQNKNSLQRKTRLHRGTLEPTKYDEESGQMLKRHKQVTSIFALTTKQLVFVRLI